MNIVFIGFIASFIAGSATILGALSVFFLRKVSDKFLDTSLDLAFAAGAMLFVTSEEIIPETHSRGNAREATIGPIFWVYGNDAFGIPCGLG